MAWGQQESVEFAIKESIAGDLATVVDAIRGRELPRRIGDEGVEINRNPMLPKAGCL